MTFVETKMALAMVFRAMAHNLTLRVENGRLLANGRPPDALLLELRAAKPLLLILLAPDSARRTGFDYFREMLPKTPPERPGPPTKLDAIAQLATDWRAVPNERAAAWSRLTALGDMTPTGLMASLSAPEPEPQLKHRRRTAGAHYFDWDAWQESAKGNLWIDLPDCTVTLFKDRHDLGRWKWCVAWSARERPHYSPRSFADLYEARDDAWRSEIAAVPA
jgi:hypothetical protein